MDLSKPIYDANGVKYRLVAQRQSALWKFNASQYGNRTVTSYVSSKDFVWIAQNAFHTASDLTSVTIDSPLLQYINNDCFRGDSNLRSLSLRIPNAGYIGFDFTSGASNIGSDARDWRLDSITNLQPRAFNALASLAGAVYLPSLKRIGHQALYNCKSIKGLVLGSENPSDDGLVHVGADADHLCKASQASTEQTLINNAKASDGDVNKISVGYGLALDFLVIGKGDNVVFDDYAFSGVNFITNIFFCGDMPTFGTTVFRHLTEKYAAIYIPRNNDTYAAAIASVTAPTAAERAEFEAHHAPGTLIGMVNSQTYFGGNGGRKQFLAYGNYRQYLNDIVVTGLPTGVTCGAYPDLYWECNRTIRDIDTSSDHTLVAPPGIMLNGMYRYVSGYTLKTATIDGWSAPVTYAGNTYVRPSGTKGTVCVDWIWSETSATTSSIAAPDDATWPGDAVTLAYANGTEIAPGSFVTPGVIILTPSWTVQDDYPKSGFVRWENLPEGATVDSSNRVTFEYDGTQSGIRAVFRHDWVYDSNDGTVFNRRYRLRVTSLGSGKLAVGTSDAMSADSSVSYGNAFIVGDDMKAGGHLDLNGLITDSAGAGSWTITKIGYRSLSPWSSVANDARVSTYYPTHVRTPETLAELTGATFCTSAWDYTPMTNLVVVTPYLKTLPNFFAQGHRTLYRLRLDCPALTTMGQGVVNCGNMCLRDTDVSEWNLPSVTTLNTQTFGNNCTYPGAHGTLDLPKVVTLSSQALSALTGVAAFYLGTNGCTLATIGSHAFWKCTALKKLVIGAKGSISITDTNLLPENTALETIEFPGSTTPENLETLLDALLAYKTVTAGPSAYVKVVGSKDYGFGSRISWSDMTAAEEEAKPDSAFGVYVTTNTSERKAYLVDNGYVPAGLYILFK